MAEISALPGVSIPPTNDEVNAELVKILEHLLEKAKGGHLRALAYCTYDSAGMIGTGWESGAHAFCLAAAVMSLSHRYSAYTWPEN